MLDDATCGLITERARFKPGTDAKGHAVGGFCPSRVRWKIQGNSAPMNFPRSSFNEIVRYQFDQAGKIVGCDYTGPMSADAALYLCDAAKAAAPVAPLTGKDGKPIAKVITFRQWVTIDDKSHAQ